ncbi:MAG: hypothetical protein LBD20_04950 [Spirochaetaceae bacterium]|jgi:hypothetical protein|nr:hypothetical protein [Spirochaetaceae bacterium]
MKMAALKDEKSYQKVVYALKRRSDGLTVADVVARSALPVETVKELLPIAADEYSARLQVTESGEILYKFPRLLTSKYKGAGVFLRKAFCALRNGIKTAAVFIFKIWIMLMLVGYFALFMLIALAAMVLSVAGNSSGSNNRRDSGGGMYLFSGILNMIIRIWFYSELTRSLSGDYHGYGYQRRRRPKGKPLYKAIFSFVFGDGDPNADIETREKQAFIAYTQANNGVISLPEFMTLTGLPPLEADEKIIAYCAEFGGSPEATEDGTVVYVFEKLLLRADKTDRSYADFSAPIKKLKLFSSNEKKMNVWFGVINTVNLLFGSYYLYNAVNAGPITTQAAFNASSKLYGYTYVLFHNFVPGANHLPVITYALGVVPLVFSAIFWLIPAIRSRLVKKDNEKIKMHNLRKIGYKTVLDKRLGVRASDINPLLIECKPSKSGAKEQVIKDFGAYSMPDVSIDGTGEAVYGFKSLDDELSALARCRRAVRKEASDLGGIVFDTGSETRGVS